MVCGHSSMRDEFIKTTSVKDKFYPHNTLGSASWYYLKVAREYKEARSINCMVSMLLCAFTLEAFLNLLGQELLEDWHEKEKLSPEDKLEEIAQKIGIEFDRSRRPFQTVKRIFRFRNQLAHAKPRIFEETYDEKIDEKELEKFWDEGSDISTLPKAEIWLEECTLKNAERFYEDREAIIEILRDKTHLEADFSMTEWSVSIRKNPRK